MTRDGVSEPDPVPDVVAELPPAKAEAEAAAPEPAGILEFVLSPEDLLALARLPELERSGPSRKIAMVWYDSSDGALADDGLSLVREGPLWRLQRSRPGDGEQWAAATPPPTLDEGASPAALQPTPPFDAGPVAAFDGRQRTYRAAAGEIRVLHGALRGIVAERPACRVTLLGAAAALPAMAQAMAAGLRLSVPRASLAVEAAAVARGGTLGPRHLGAPAIGGDVKVSDSLARIIDHLLDVVLHWSDRCRAAAQPEAVHQARVATRRLRSALSIYKRAAPCPELAALAPALKDCAARLGTARDWDVFLETTGARLRDGSRGDLRVAALLRTALRRRNEAYAELRVFLDSPAFRELEIGLACAAGLRPWERTADPAALGRDTAAFAAEVLDRRLKRVRRDGRRIAELPVPALHELRKDCKRLRYAAEFFVPGFPKSGARRFIRRLEELQEELGVLNDTAAATQLLGQLGRAGRGYAGGLVEGWAASAATPARDRICKAWKGFREAPPFWR